MNTCHCGHPIHDAYCTEYVSAAIAYRVVPDFIGDGGEYITETVHRFPCQCIRRNGVIPFSKEEDEMGTCQRCGQWNKLIGRYLASTRYSLCEACVINEQAIGMVVILRDSPGENKEVLIF